MSGILIGLTGATGVGKDTIAKMLMEARGAVRLAFGDPVKAAAREAFGLEPKWLTDSAKTTVHPYWGITPREMYQRLATEAMRGEFGQDFWVRRLQQDYEAVRALDVNRMIVITDVRFNGEDTERNWVRAQGGFIVHVNGPQRREDINHNHVSNTPILRESDDLVLDNFGTVDGLAMKTGMLLAQIERRMRDA